MPNYGHLSLSCAKIERPSPLEKPSCKVRLFAQNRSRNYRQKVTAASSISNHFSSRFSASRTNAPRSLSCVKVGTHSAFGKGSHTRAHTAKQGAFRTGALLLPSERSTRFGNPAWPDVRTANFAAFCPWSGVFPKNTESLRDSDALMRVAVPRRRGPAGLRNAAVLASICFEEVTSGGGGDR